MSRLNFIQGDNLRLWNLCQCYVTGCYGAFERCSAHGRQRHAADRVFACFGRIGAAAIGAGMPEK